MLGCENTCSKFLVTTNWRKFATFSLIQLILAHTTKSQQCSGANEKFVTPCRRCDSTCLTKDNPICFPVIQPSCPGAGCSCQFNYVRSDTTGQCILRSDCPAVGTTTSRMAVARMISAQDGSVAGIVNVLENADGTIRISGTLQNLASSGTSLSNAQIGMHIHQFGDLSVPNCAGGGVHWNPTNQAHGSKTSSVRHIGDLGNIAVDSTGIGNARIDTTKTLLPLSGIQGIVGRMLVVHAQEDDLGVSGTGTSSTNGNSGSPVACGVVGIASEDGSTWEPGGGTFANDAPTPATSYREAIAVLTSSSNPATQLGTVQFIQPQGSTSIRVLANLTGVAPVNASHGIHVHALGDLSQNDCTAGGNHYNPATSAIMTHGGRASAIRHMGDMGNVAIGASGVGNVDFTVGANFLPMVGPYSIVGRLLVLHQDPDDLGQGGNTASSTTGNSGARIACGVVGIKSEFTYADNAAATGAAGGGASEIAPIGVLTFMMFLVAAIIRFVIY